MKYPKLSLKCLTYVMSIQDRCEAMFDSTFNVQTSHNEIVQKDDINSSYEFFFNNHKHGKERHLEY